MEGTTAMKPWNRQQLVAIDWRGAELDPQPVIDYIGEALFQHTVEERLLGARGSEAWRKVHVFRFDAGMVRNTDVHGAGYRAGFIVHIEQAPTTELAGPVCSVAGCETIAPPNVADTENGPCASDLDDVMCSYHSTELDIISSMELEAVRGLVGDRDLYRWMDGESVTDIMAGYGREVAAR